MGNFWMKQSGKFGSPLYEPLLHATAKYMNPKAPDMPAAPVATPPQSPNSQASVDAENAMRMQQNRRKSLNATIFAGATGGYQSATGGAAPSTGGTKTKTG